MKQTLTLITLALFTISTSAQWGEKIKGNGTIKTIERSTEDYESIALSAWFDIDLIAGTEGKISIEGDENLLEYIKTEVKDGKLTIKIEKGINLKPSSNKNGIKIKIPVESIESLAVSGSGNIVAKTLIKSEKFKTSMSGSGNVTLDIETKYLAASMSGSGDMNITGSSKEFKVNISGSGDINAYDLETDVVEASVSGSADIKVTANKRLKARVSGSGDIKYKGNPEKVDTKSSGSGDISES